MGIREFGFKKFFQCFATLVKQHNEFYQQKKLHPCKIDSVEKDPRTDEYVILVKMEGVKNQLPVKFTPEELITNDSLLSEFSQIDVRAVTYCAIKKTPHQFFSAKEFIAPKFYIQAQEILSGKTVFVIHSHQEAIEQRILAQDLFASKILKEFCFKDIRNIIYTAAFEQTLEEME